MDKLAAEILDFWTEVGMAGWYADSAEFDDKVRSKYKEAWSDALAGKYAHWKLEASSSLALIILLDQFPRNMFRGDGASFASDRMALCVAKKAMDRDFDLQVTGDMRQFFYLPLMHSECKTDQDAAVRAFCNRMPNPGNLLHARAHRKVIRDFGRFPYRNDVLGRPSTEKEIAYLDAGGYRFTVEGMDK